MKQLSKAFWFQIFIFISLAATGQVLRPATWSYDQSIEEVKVGDQIELIFKARIDNKWYFQAVRVTHVPLLRHILIPKAARTILENRN